MELIVKVTTNPEDSAREGIEDVLSALGAVVDNIRANTAGPLVRYEDAGALFSLSGDRIGTYTLTF